MASTRTATAESGPVRYRLTVDEFDRMCEVGIFDEDDRIELLDGQLYGMPPAGDWHNAGVSSISEELRPRQRGEHIVFTQNSVQIGPASKPQPDVTILRYRADHYRDGGPKTGDILLVVEVSDTSVRHDREFKLGPYAASGVPEVWIVTRAPAAIEVYRGLRAGVYTDTRTFARGESVTTDAIPGISVAVADVTG